MKKLFSAERSIELNKCLYLIVADKYPENRRSFYCYEIGKKQWTKCSNAIANVAYLTKSLSKRLIYAFGDDATVQQYDPEQDTWTMVPPTLTSV